MKLLPPSRKRKTSYGSSKKAFGRGHHWYIMLGSTILLSFGLIGFSAYTFLEIQKTIENDTITLSEPEGNLDKEALENIIEDFETKERTRARIIERAPLVSDPSSPLIEGL